jgi:beta-glucanase (GH16 family)
MDNGFRWSARVAGVALGLVGLSVAGAMPTEVAWSAGSAKSAASAAAGTRVEGSTANAKPAVASKAASSSNQAAARYGWGKVVGGDEFNYRGAPSSRKWRVYNSRGHAGKGWRRPSAWHVNGSVATVTGSPSGTTGGMSSRHARKYGRWEARMKTNVRDPQYHPNILLWPHVGTKNCPEVNFAESTSNRKLVKFFLHYGCQPRQTQKAKAVNTTRWHTYAVEWTPTHITGYIDGVPYFRDNNRGHLPKVSMHAAIQLDWFRNKARTRKSTMSVDWIRIYRA